MIKKINLVLLGVLITTSPVYAEYSALESNKITAQQTFSVTDFSCPNGQHISRIKEKCANTGCGITDYACS